MIEERIVTIEEVNHPYAVVRDDRGATFEIQTSILPARGMLPRAGERWVVTRDWLSGWRWVGYIEITGRGGSSYSEVLGDGTAAIYNVMHMLGTTDIIVQVRDADGVVLDPTITIADTNHVIVEFAAPLAVDGAVAVVLSV